MNLKKHIIFFGYMALLISCSSPNLDVDNGVDIPTSNKPNILLIIADDMGLDATPNYPEGSIKPNMPILQGLMNAGITFENFWSYPVCSPTRASILTGKYGSKTGVLEVSDNISTTETSIQKFINTNSSIQASYA